MSGLASHADDSTCGRLRARTHAGIVRAARAGVRAAARPAQRLPPHGARLLRLGVVRRTRRSAARRKTVDAMTGPPDTIEANVVACRAVRFMRYSDLPGTQLKRAARERGERPPHICHWCLTSLDGLSRRRTWCSQSCVDEYLIRSSASYAREKVFERDRGVCARCHVDTEAIRLVIDESRRRAIDALDHDPACWEGRHAGRWHSNYYYRRLGEVTAEFSRLLSSRLKRGAHGHLWEAHHTTAVVEGGGWCGLDGYETVCIGCHNAETAALL